MLPTTADIFVDRCSGAKTKQDVEKIVQDLQGHLYDGAFEPDNNLDDEPLVFHEFPDGSKAGCAAEYDDHGEIKGWHAWNRLSHRTWDKVPGDMG